MPEAGSHTLTSDPRTMIMHMSERAEEEGIKLLAKHGREATPEAIEHAGYVLFTAMCQKMRQTLTPSHARRFQQALQQLEAEALASTEEQD